MVLLFYWIKAIVWRIVKEMWQN